MTVRYNTPGPPLPFAEGRLTTERGERHFISARAYDGGWSSMQRKEEKTESRHFLQTLKRRYTQESDRDPAEK